MTAKEIAEKYVYGRHDVLTDRQEVIDMEADILAFAEKYHLERTRHLQEIEEQADKNIREVLTDMAKHGTKIYFGLEVGPLDGDIIELIAEEITPSHKNRSAFKMAHYEISVESIVHIIRKLHSGLKKVRQ